VIEVGPVADDERLAFVNAFGAAFSHVFKQEVIDDLLHLFDEEVYRPFAARSGGQIVGTGLDMPLDLTVAEGVTVPCRGVTWISVLPTHRRRGVMRALMADHDAECARQGAAASLLHSSVSGLYAGYGVAARRARVTVATPHIEFLDAPPEVDLRLADPVESVAACQAVWERCRLATTGFTTRPEPEITWALKDLEGFCVFAGDDGYVLYTVDRRWPGPNAEYRIKVQELMAATREAYAALWQYVCGLTHVVEVEANGRPVDEPLQHLVRQPRRVDVSHANDGVWLRPYDRAALSAARGLPDPGEAVGDGAFASLLLGAFTPASLARAGRIPEGAAADWVSATVPWSPLEF
jgi:predicted acetyltransferase